MGSSTLGMLLDLFILLVAWAHVLIAPYTKVEESFNLHATHDILAYGVTPSALPNVSHFDLQFGSGLDIVSSTITLCFQALSLEHS